MGEYRRRGRTAPDNNNYYVPSRSVRLRASKTFRSGNETASFCRLSTDGCMGAKPKSIFIYCLFTTVLTNNPLAVVQSNRYIDRLRYEKSNVRDDVFKKKKKKSSVIVASKIVMILRRRGVRYRPLSSLSNGPVF